MAWNTDAERVSVLRLLQSYDQSPGQRLTLQDAARAAARLGLSEHLLEHLYAGVQPALRREGGWTVLTPGGKRWYEESFAEWMSRAE
jgi:hypothetical protein